MSSAWRFSFVRDLLKCVKIYHGLYCSSRCMNPLHPSSVCVCEYGAMPFVSVDKWSCTLQTCTFSTQLNGLSQIIKWPFISEGHWRGLSGKPNTERPVWGTLSLTLRPTALWVVVAFECSTWGSHWDEKVLKGSWCFVRWHNWNFISLIIYSYSL